MLQSKALLYLSTLLFPFIRIRVKVKIVVNKISPNPINAVVVHHDPFKANNPDSKTMVILTNSSVDKPLDVYERYDARSEIENSLFREAKQAWFIT